MAQRLLESHYYYAAELTTDGSFSSVEGIPKSLQKMKRLALSQTRYLLWECRTCLVLSSGLQHNQRWCTGIADGVEDFMISEEKLRGTLSEKASS